MHLHVYVNGRLCIIESNPAWAVPYWTARRQVSPSRITFKLVKECSE